MPHIQGRNRTTVLALPPTLDEYITPDNPTRVIDAFVDQLDLAALGFQRAVAKPRGRPAYHPADLLKLFLYGYLNRIRSSRALERETHRNLELIWLLNQLTPDFKTIAAFRATNTGPIKAVCREFVLLCKELDLFGAELVAIDGSKFKAVNNYKRNFNDQRLERAIAELDTAIQRYLTELDACDRADTPPQQARAAVVRVTLAKLRAQHTQYTTVRAALAASDERQISLTDPDSRAMPVSQGTMVAYNVQTAVDAKHKLIVAHEVTTAVTDQDRLAPIAAQAKAVLDVATLDVVADRGYYNGVQIQACLAHQITPWVPKPHTSANQRQGLFTKADFVYDRAHDTYRCPQGATLTYRFSCVEHGRPTRYYATPACTACPLKARCTRNQHGRRISRWEHEELLDAMAERIHARPEVTRQRKALVEHPFGTMKRGMRQGDFLLCGLEKVRAEMSLTVLAYNVRRVLNIVGVERLLAVLRARGGAVMAWCLGLLYPATRATWSLPGSRPRFRRMPAQAPSLFDTVSACVGLG